MPTVHTAPPPRSAARRGGPTITVADSPRAAQWLRAIAARTEKPWQVRELGDEVPYGLLVLTQPGEYPEALRHWIAAHQVVVSLDSPQGRSLAFSNRIQTFTFSEGRNDADLTARDLRLTPSGQLRFVAFNRSALTRIGLEDPDDLYPALAALACAVWLGVPLSLAGEVVSDPAVLWRPQEIKMA